MADSIFTPSKSASTNSSSPSIFSSTPSQSTTPTVAQAVNSIKTPSLLNRIESGAGDVIKSIFSSPINEAVGAVKNLVTGNNKPTPALTGSIITGPKLEDINAQEKELNDLKNNINVYNQNDVNTYNKKVQDYQTSVSQYNAAQKAQSVLNPQNLIPVGQTIKFPFIKNGILVPSSGAVGGVYSILKAGVEAPERSARSLASLVGQDTQTQNRTGDQTYQVPSYAEVAGKTTAQILDEGLLTPVGAVIIGSALGGGEFANDALLYSGFLESGAAKVADETMGAITDNEVQTAHEFLGNPKTMEEARANYLKIQKEFHPDITGGDDTISKQANNAYNILKKEGIPTGARAGTINRKPTPTPENLKQIADEVSNSVQSKSIPEIKSQVEEIASSFKPKTPSIEGINPEQETRLTAEEAKPLAESASNQYFNNKITPAIESGKAIIIGSDDLKDYFGKDYNDNNHPVYSQAADNLYKKAVTQSPADTVKFTVGGTGSGKSDFLVPEMARNFKGVVYDSTGYNYDGIKKQIDFAKANGKTPEVYAIVPDIARARLYTFMRENAGEHPVTEAAFIKTHSQAINTLIKLIADGVNVHLLDTRNAYTSKDVYSLEYVNKPLDLLKNLEYSENNVKNKISGITKENAEEILKTREGRSIEVSKENGPSEEIKNNGLQGETKTFRTDSEGPQLAFRRGGERVGNRSSRTIQARLLSEDVQRRGGDGAFSPELAGKIVEGETVPVDVNTPKVLEAFGFSPELINKFNFYFDKGAFSNLSISNNYRGAQAYEALFDEGNNALVLSPDEIDNPKFIDGSVISHEVAGHSWYNKLSPEGKINFYETLKQNKNVLKEAWGDQKSNPHSSYWSETIDQIHQNIAKVNGEKVADKILSDFQLEHDVNISIDEFINKTLNIDKKIEAINTELERIGENRMTLKAENISAIQEHIAMIAENANELVAPKEDALSNYIEDVNNGTLKYGPTGERALTYQGETDLSTTTLEKLKGRDTVSKQFIQDLSNSGDLKQAERDIIRDVLTGYPDGEKVSVTQFAKDVKIELLPLRIKSRQAEEEEFAGVGLGADDGSPVALRYEGITLPDDSRGNVANYDEHIYESPIKTSAGETHFSGQSDNYFGHTRVEDMAPSANAEIIREGLKKGRYASAGRQGRIALRKELADLEAKDTGRIRRVIEVQSDLYQKGNLEKDFANARGPANDQSIKYWENAIKENPKDQEAIDQLRFSKEAKKLSQYNDPTAHFRMVREEVKKAAEDGKTKLQFPTGETAMKIEGLGDTNIWHLSPQGNEVSIEGQDMETGIRLPLLTQQSLKVGETITSLGQNGAWIITDVLGDGKFKAVPKHIYESTIGKGTNTEHNVYLDEGRRRNAIEIGTETFDISGKVDTNNPIYKFYEKDLGRYLRNKYSAQTVIDDKGVTWNEVAIKPEMATAPVIAFRQKTQDVEQLTKMLEREQENLKNTEENPIKINERIAELQQRIKDAKNPVFNSGDKLKDVQDTLAFAEHRMGVKTAEISKAQNMLNREQLSLDASKENPEIFKQVYGENRIEEHKAKVSELRQKLMDLNKEVTEIQSNFKPEDLEKAVASLRPENLAPKIRVLDKEVQIPTELTNRQISLEIKKEALENSPYKELQKYIAKSGAFKGELPEVTGSKPTKENIFYGKIKDSNVLDFIKKGDQIISNAFQAYKDIPDTETVREGMQNFLKERENLKTERKQVLADLKSFIKTEKDKIAVEKLAQNKNEEIDKEQAKAQKIADNKREAETLADWKNFIASYSSEMSLPQSLSEVIPPTVRGNIQSPKLDLIKAKDKGWMARESLDRNIEKVFTREDAKKLNEFLGDHLRENMAKEVEYKDAKFKSLEEEMKKLGIKPGSDESAFVQIYGEGKTSIDELMKEFPNNWQNIQKAVSVFKKMYETILNDWNPIRNKFNYPDIPPVKNYFPHFNSISFWTKHYGILDRNDDLPTSIAGLTKNFQPSKTFNRHELHRIGHKTEYDAIIGAKEYINSVAKQMFTMDSIARASAILKYIRISDETGQRLGTPLNLSRFTTNLQNIKQNQLASKTGGLDREIEDNGDRKVINMTLALSKLVGKNIIAFNPATVLSHGVSLALNAATVNKIPLVKGMMTTVSSPFSKDPYYMIDGQRSDLLFYRYPKEYLKTKFETVDEAGGWMIKQMDIFKTRTAVASKYYELTQQGVAPEIAIKEADKYAGRIVGDYARGQKPNLLSQKLFKIVAQFQFGMNDAMSVLTHDIPYQNKKTDANGNVKTDLLKMWWKIAQWMVFAYLMNEYIYKPIKGSGKGLSPINLILDLAGADDATRGTSVVSRVGTTAVNVATELPFLNVLNSNSPLFTAFSQPIKDAIAGNLFKAGTGFVSTFASPIGGGVQVKKTLEGIQAYRQGFVATKSGTPAFGVNKSGWGLLQNILFGPSATAAAQAYYNSIGKPSTGKATFDEVQKLLAEGKTAEATAITSAMTPKEYGTYKAEKTRMLETKAIPEAQKILDLVKNGKTDEATKLTEAMSPEDYKIYQGAKAMILKATAGLANNNNNGVANFEGHTTYYGGSKGPDASVILSGNLDDGQIKGYNAKGEPIFARDTKLEASRRAELIKQDPYWSVTASQYDHIIPLEAGGTNTADNVQLISKVADEGNQPFENYIGGLYKTGGISRADAAKASIDYKIKKTVSLDDIINGKY